MTKAKNLPNPSGMIVNSASVHTVNADGLQAVVEVHTSYGKVVVSAGVPTEQLAAQAGRDPSEAPADVWIGAIPAVPGPPVDAAWLPAPLRRYDHKQILALVRRAAINAWRTHDAK